MPFLNADRVGISLTADGLSCLLPPKVAMGLIRMQEEDVEDGL